MPLTMPWRWQACATLAVLFRLQNDGGLFPSLKLRRQLGQWFQTSYARPCLSFCQLLLPYPRKDNRLCAVPIASLPMINYGCQAREGANDINDGAYVGSLAVSRR